VKGMFYRVSGARPGPISLDCGHPGASIFSKFAKSRQNGPIRPDARTPAISRSTPPCPVSGGIKVGLEPPKILQTIFGNRFAVSRFVSRESKRIGRKAATLGISSLSAAEGSAIHGRRPLFSSI